MSKLFSAADTIVKIPNDTTLATARYVGIGFPRRSYLRWSVDLSIAEIQAAPGQGDASERGQRIPCITEGAVFELDAEGIRPIQIAPGVELERDILAIMVFKPRIVDNLETMDKALFQCLAQVPVQATRITGQLKVFRIRASTSGLSWREMIAQSNPDPRRAS